MIHHSILFLADSFILDTSVIAPFLVMLVVVGFMPLSVTSYFLYMMDKKEADFQKNKQEMGIKSTKSVKDVFNSSKYFLPVTFATIVCLMQIILVIYPDLFVSDSKDSLILAGSKYGAEGGNITIVNQNLVALTYAFFGSFMWASMTIVRRLNASDLPPSVYYSAGLRILLASIVALLVGFTTQEMTEFNQIGLPSLAFIAGMFPESIVSFFIKKYKDWVNPSAMNTEILRLDNIEGISVQHRERLEEIGIDNAQNLAAASVTDLMIQTPFPTRQLLDWIGQAKLLCYAKEDMSKLQSVGIRSIFDLYSYEHTPTSLNRLALSAQLTTNAVLLENIYAQIINDDGIASLYEFRQRLNSPAGPSDDIQRKERRENWAAVSDQTPAPAIEPVMPPSVPDPTAPPVADTNDVPPVTTPTT